MSRPDRGALDGPSQRRAALTADQEAPAARRSRTRLVVQVVVSLVLVVAILYFTVKKTTRPRCGPRSPT
jgi:hypothetical protein